MPNSNFKDSDRFNLMLALTAFLVDGGEYRIEELVTHFNAPEEEIREAVRLIGFTELIEIYPRGPYQVDFDELNQGFVSISFSHSADLTEVPRLSPRQTSAIVAGLVYLRSLPGLAEVGEIEELQNILASGINREESTLEIDIVPGSIDADLVIVRDALSRGLSLRCDYLNNRGETTIGRIIEPLRLEPTAEVVYVRAFCPEKQSVRSFRLDRMRQVQVLEDRPISEEARSAELNDEIYTPSENDLDVVLEVEPEAYGLIHEFKPAESPEQVSKYVKRFTVKIGDVRTLGRIIARFGGAARVISPPEAKKAVHEFALEAISGKPKRTPKDAE
ncbi:MAG: WYL domain-containing protein [Microbacteriaceae bacterium]|nr:WYL domain-containing protein [Microbacteriaceae bacterium]